MGLVLPADHQPRYSDFEIVAVSDETLREGGERALFGADDKRKLKLVEALATAGVRDIDVGSGLTEVNFLRRILDAKHLFHRIPADTTFSFNLTLKTFKPLLEALRVLPRDYLAEIYVSVGMIEINENKQLFEHALEQLAAIGVGRFRASILNAFSDTVDDDRYAFLIRQIDRCRQAGVSMVRVNDSIGSLLPHTTELLAANLTRDNPDMMFYLHAHNDRGLGTANALISVFNGFSIIEGGVAGFGNRAGLAELEVISTIFDENDIRVATGPIDTQRLRDAAQLAEEVFLVVPDPYRPVSGAVVENENAGIVNVPDYLGVSRDVDYFLNRIGLFPVYLRQMLEEAGVTPEYTENDDFIEAVYDRLTEQTSRTYATKRRQYTALMHDMREFYAGVMRLEDVYFTALDVLAEDSVRQAV